jgi:uncharacterized protein (TIGR03083 family)
MEPLDPIDVVDLFPEERGHLVHLLSALSDAQWSTPTVCPGWTVKDVALHVLGVDIGNLSIRRDGFGDPSTAAPDGDAPQWAQLVAFVNRLNEAWVRAARRISPRLLCELLGFTGDALSAYFRSLDPAASGGPVSWAGPAPAPVWLDIAREYTERWVHQQQIRDALDQPGLKEPRYFAPVLATFVHALPHTLRDVTAAPGACVRLVIGGAAGGAWRAMRTDHAWALGQDRGTAAAATVTMDQDVAWRLFTGGMAREEAMRRVRLEGDRALGAKVLEMVSIIA